MIIIGGFKNIFPIAKADAPSALKAADHLLPKAEILVLNPKHH